MNRVASAYDLKPDLPPGYYLICAAYGVGSQAYLAAFLCFDTTTADQPLVTGQWDGSVIPAQVRDVRRWNTNSEGIYMASCEYSRLAHELLMGHIALFGNGAKGGFRV